MAKKANSPFSLLRQQKRKIEVNSFWKFPCLEEEEPQGGTPKSLKREIEDKLILLLILKHLSMMGGIGEETMAKEAGGLIMLQELEENQKKRAREFRCSRSEESLQIYKETTFIQTQEFKIDIIVQEEEIWHVT